MSKSRLEIIMRNHMPDGTDIQLEHWGRVDGTFDAEIGVYPVCKESMEPWRRKNETFRLTLVRLPQEHVEDIYRDLIQGKLTLFDCRQYFYRPQDDAHCLGMEPMDVAA